MNRFSFFAYVRFMNYFQWFLLEDMFSAVWLDDLGRLMFSLDCFFSYVCLINCVQLLPLDTVVPVMCVGLIVFNYFLWVKSFHLVCLMVCLEPCLHHEVFSAS